MTSSVATGNGLLFVGGIPAEDLAREARPVPGPVFGDLRTDAVSLAMLERIRVRARSALLAAVKDGRIIRPPACSRCHQDGPTHGHHADYRDVFNVEWLCGPCHQAESKRIREEARARLSGYRGRPRWAREGSGTTAAGAVGATDKSTLSGNQA